MFHRPIVTHRYFFALRPPPVRARQISQAAPWLKLDSAVAAERLHVTLFILDDLPRQAADLEARLRRIGEGVRAAPVDVRLDRIGGAGGSFALRPSLVIPGLRALHRTLADLAGATGVRERVGYRFSPHLTLGYRAGAPFSTPVEPVEWRADELVLIHSRVGRTVHDVLGRWPLAGGTQLALF